jgi:predicted NAD/FAD-dependent oxidoreductase
VTSPAGQAAELLRSVPLLAARARKSPMHGCWAVMLAVTDSLRLGYDGAFVHASPLAWIARNSSKPGRPQESETWVLHASSEWSESHIEESPQAVMSELIDEFWRAVGASPVPVQYRSAHRWRFALPPQPLDDSSLFDSTMRVGACGDWCGGPRVEGAFLSGMAVAGRVLGMLNETESCPALVDDASRR